MTSATGTHSSARYRGARPCKHLNTSRHSLTATRREYEVMQIVNRMRSGCDAPAFENADTENEREQQLVLFKERSTDVAVDAVSEVGVENIAALGQVVALLAYHYRLQQPTVHAIRRVVALRYLDGVLATDRSKIRIFVILKI